MSRRCRGRCRGLWYPVIVALVTLVGGGLFLRDAKPDFDIHH